MAYFIGFFYTLVIYSSDALCRYCNDAAALYGDEQQVATLLFFVATKLNVHHQ
ncbi:hypothetical protein [uncultured Rikenella sp.]|uniref:hypothetical protein n=1 Tax=uncultured Rikenella sp. TaxID=368003 RepID=UPI002603F96F|nr:hypothetical protein [uncultured Rikenella sp.]